MVTRAGGEGKDGTSVLWKDGGACPARGCLPRIPTFTATLWVAALLAGQQFRQGIGEITEHRRYPGQMARLGVSQQPQG